MNHSAETIIRSVKGLSLSAIQAANSGHTSFPLAMAEIGYSLFFKQMNYLAQEPNWLNRDRLVLSAGHGSMFLYSFLHLLGYPLTIEDIKQFRQLNSKTPGHPEFGHTVGIECTTGPLGQGVANAIGMALSQAHLAAVFNTSDFKIFDHDIYCLCGDGDLMEGVAQEAISLAGHLQLNRLIMIYDFNRITIDGKTDITYSENVVEKFKALDWFIQEIDGHDLEQIDQAVETAKQSDKPSLIIAKTISGKGAVNWEGSNQVHGNPLKPEDYAASFERLNLNPFQVIPEAYEIANQHQKELKKHYDAWTDLYQKWRQKYPEMASKFDLYKSVDINLIQQKLTNLDLNKKAATRSLSGEVLNAISSIFPGLIGGSADLAGSNNTTIKSSNFINRNDFSGQNIHFGIREHAMAAIANGIAYSGVLKPYIGTFLVFSDYMRPSIRLAALAKLPVIYVFTHDSFYVGEDGPTHHPVEHVSSLRLIPDLIVIRPADGEEVKHAWLLALQSKKPVALCLTRQNVEPIDRSSLCELDKGAYIVKESISEPELIILASGSELSLVCNTVQQLNNKDQIRIVSVPSTNLFDEQTNDYRNKIIPKQCRKRIFVEAGSGDLHYKYIGEDGLSISMDHFSKSAPYQDLESDFGFVPDQIKTKITTYLDN